MSLSQTPQYSKRETKLARSLVHPDKPVRDATLAALVEYCRGVKKLTDLEMMKLWKALYYCMWLADKREIQEELADSFAQMIADFRSNKLKLQYIQMFFKIILREWTHLDMHRMNKFYYLIRVITRKGIQIGFEQLPKTDLLTSFNEILATEVLNQRPNGIRFHVSDLFLGELFKATGSLCNTQSFLLSIEPFFNALTTGDDNVVMDRIAKAIFQGFIENHSKESTDATQVFDKVDSRYIQAKLFDLASAPETEGRYRNRLYALHKLFAEATNIDFVDVQTLQEGVANEGEEDRGDKKDKKKKKKRAASEIAESTVVAAEEPVVEEGKKKKKKKSSA